MNTILIIIALILGYIQGFRKKRMRVRRELEAEKLKNKELLKSIDLLEKRKRLQQYTNDPKVKYKSDYFEEMMVRYVTVSSSNYEYVSFLYSVLGHFNFPEEEYVKLPKIYERMQDTIDLSNLSKNVNTKLKVKNQIGLLIEYDMKSNKDTIFYLLNEVIRISEYEITYAEMKISLEYILSADWEETI